YDPEKHTLYFRYHQGEQMRQLIPEIEVQMMGLGDVQPSVKDVTDVKTGALNSAITPGKAVKVRGAKIKITGEHPDTGIFFVSGGGERTRVENDEIITNNPSELVVMVPLLPAGTYRLEVVTQYSGGSLLLKEPRIAVFSKPLTVG
ncbi:MAG: DUF4469 domain-containing protein, partial [Cytophagaceae bacterium]|nr:DUF4469 domain-containing protein [Cytophagaceae bacterium]